MPVTRSDVEDLDSTGWQGLPDSKKDELLSVAENEVNNQYSAKVARLPTLVGDKDDAIKHLAAHKWELAEGGEPDSESQTGGNVSYNTSSGTWDSTLSETRYGRTFRDVYLRDEQNIGIVITR